MGLRLRARVLALTAAASVAMLAVLVLPAAPASAATVSAQLTLNGVSFNGATVSVLTVNAGDSIVFAAGSDTLSVRLHVGTLPGASDATLYAIKTETVSFPAAGSFGFSWTATPLIGHAVNQDASVQVNGPSSSPPPSSSSATSPSPSSSSSAPGASPSSSVAGVSASRTPGASGSRAGFTAAPDGGLLGLNSSAAGSTTAAGRTTTSGGQSSSSAAGAALPTDATPGAALQADIGHSSTSQPTALAIVSILALAGVLASYAYLYFGRRLTGLH